MQIVWALASLWVRLALIATLLAIWFKNLHSVERDCCGNSPRSRRSFCNWKRILSQAETCRVLSSMYHPDPNQLQDRLTEFKGENQASLT